MRLIIKVMTIAFFAWFFCLAPEASADPFHELSVIRPKVRVEAPAFTLTNINGATFDSKNEFKGKVTFLNFWATWCAPCREEMPAFTKLWKKFRNRGFTIVSVSADRGDSDLVREFSDRFDIGFTVLLDPEGKVRNEYEVTALPTTYIVGKDGLITGKIIGSAPWDSPAAVKLIENLLNSNYEK